MRGSILARLPRLSPHNGAGTSLGQSFGKLLHTLLYASNFSILAFTVTTSEHQIFGYKEKVMDFTLQVLLKSFFALFPESVYLFTFFLSVGGN
jgi:hypothetical protein